MTQPARYDGLWGERGGCLAARARRRMLSVLQNWQRAMKRPPTTGTRSGCAAIP
jgi:hypothetical protein